MQSIDRWDWFLSLGSFLAAVAVSFFAISSIYEKLDLKKHEAMLKHLHILHKMLLTREVDNGSRKTLIEIDPIKGMDNMLLWGLFENLSLEDWNALNITKVPVALDKIPDSLLDDIKLDIYRNRGRIPGLIGRIGSNYRWLRLLYKFMASIFILGLLIQICALLNIY